MKRRDTAGGVSSLDTQRQSSVAPLSPSVAAPPLGQTASMMGTSSRFFGVSARGVKLMRPLSTTADLGVVFTVRLLVESTQESAERNLSPLPCVVRR